MPGEFISHHRLKPNDQVLLPARKAVHV